jgi:dinuclear metal center YbgI/SA1388 family protein
MKRRPAKYTVERVCRAVEELAPPAWAFPWDRCGLAVGAPDAEVTAVLVALTLTRESFAAARRARAGMMVTHHPPIWEPLHALRTDDPHTRLCLDLVDARIACYAAHTNLDVAPGGVNDVLADRLGVRKTAPLLQVPQAGLVKLVTFVPVSHLDGVRRAVCQQGAGVIGEYSFCSFSSPGTGTFLPGIGAQPFSGRKHQVNEEPERRFEVLVPKALVDRVLRALKRAHPYEEVAYDLVSLENRDPAVGLGVRGELDRPLPLDTFAKRVRDLLGASHVRVVGAPKHRVCRVGVLGGSGGGEVVNLPADLDVLVTGDVKYHDALTAQLRGLAIIDATHSAAERLMVPTVAGHLRKRLKGLRVTTYMERDVFRLVP